MHKEFGGYLPFDLTEGEELFSKYEGANILRLNCGRNAIAAAMLSVKPKKVYIPYYNCNVVRDTLIKYDVPIEYYFLDENLEPKVSDIEPDEWLLYVNYFGIISKERLNKIKNRYRRVIFDNTQAFYAEPLLDPDIFNVYSCRKFVGLCDGAYLIWGGDRKVFSDYPQDISWDRAAFLFKSIELGTNAAYKENLDSKKDLGEEIRCMSVLTQKMLKAVDYSVLMEKRRRNFEILHDNLKDINCLPFEINVEPGMNYPLYVKDNALRKSLVENKVYVPQWWKYLLDVVPSDSIEADLSNYLLPLPVDQRYSEEDMLQLIQIVKNCYSDIRR